MRCADLLKQAGLLSVLHLRDSLLGQTVLHVGSSSLHPLHDILERLKRIFLVEEIEPLGLADTSKVSGKVHRQDIGIRQLHLCLRSLNRLLPGARVWNRRDGRCRCIPGHPSRLGLPMVIAVRDSWWRRWAGVALVAQEQAHAQHAKNGNDHQGQNSEAVHFVTSA